jgi:DNA-binding NarL/FixJ family response regulator
MKNNLNILIVEDSLIFIEGLESLLKNKGNIDKIFSAQNIAEALNIIKAVEIDIVILDLNFDTEAFNGFAVAK